MVDAPDAYVSVYLQEDLLALGYGSKMRSAPRGTGSIGSHGRGERGAPGLPRWSLGSLCDDFRRGSSHNVRNDSEPGATFLWEGLFSHGASSFYPSSVCPYPVDDMQPDRVLKATWRRPKLRESPQKVFGRTHLHFDQRPCLNGIGPLGLCTPFRWGKLRKCDGRSLTVCSGPCWSFAFLRPCFELSNNRIWNANVVRKSTTRSHAA